MMSMSSNWLDIVVEVIRKINRNRYGGERVNGFFSSIRFSVRHLNENLGQKSKLADHVRKSDSQATFSRSHCGV